MVLQVFVFQVADADASAWRSELAVASADRSQALRRLRDRGLRKRDLADPTGRPDRVLSLGEADWMVDPGLGVPENLWKPQVDTEQGLLSPVVHNAGDLSLGGLARAIADIAARARSGNLKPDELSGPTK